MASISNNLTPNPDIDMVIDPLDNLLDIGNSFDSERGRSLSLSMHKPRSPSISSSECSEEYHVCVKRMSDRMDEDEPVGTSDSIKLEYASQEGQKDQVSMATDTTRNMMHQHVSNVDWVSEPTPDNNVFNVNLNYDIDQALDPEEWDGEFDVTSLHGAMKHVASDVKNIKDSLRRMGKYIRGKAINNNPNNCKDLEGVGKELWEFLSSIYESHWDMLYADSSKNTFRGKVSSKFTSRIPKNPSTNGKEKNKAKPMFISLVSPPIPAKTPKEVNEISKYFKKNPSPHQKKSYTNATLLSTQQGSPVSKNIVKKTLKIKEMFPNLSNNKIKQVQKVINGPNNNSKLRISMTTKGPSHKQVIIPMGNNIAKEFIKESNSHVTNINRALKAIKSNMIADFICVDDKGIVVTTNNVASSLDLQEIKKYVKNSLSSNADKMTLVRLPQSKSYLKIVGIPFISKKTNSHIALDEIEDVLKNNHIFNNIVLASKPHVIKVSPKSDMAIIWIDIWNTQAGQNAKTIINCQFNIGSYIAMICGTNMNPGVP